MTRVLIPVQGDTSGGIATVLRNHLECFKPSITPVFLFLGKGNFYEEIKKNAFELYLIENVDSLNIPILLENIFYYFKNYIKVQKLIAQIEYTIKYVQFDLVHSHKKGFVLLMGEILKGRSIPLILTIHTMPKMDLYTSKIRVYLWCLFINKYVSLFYTVARVLLDQYKHVKCRTAVIHNAVPIVTKIESEIIFDEIRIGYIGRIKEAKGLHLLIDAFEELQKDFKLDLELVIAGELNDSIPYHQKIISKSHQLGNISLKGYIHSGEFFEYINILCIPSYSEVCSMSILEGMASGVPVVATSVGGTPEIIEDLVDGLLTSTCKEDIYNKLKMLIQDVEFANKIVAKARYRVENEFSIDVWDRSIRKVYKQVLK